MTEQTSDTEERSGFSGGCHCSSVRFVAEGKPIDSAICHCRSCQKTSGAESVGWAVFATSDVHWSGTERTFYASSKGVKRSFCGQCGCTLTYQNAEQTVDIALACLDEPDALIPAKEIWLDHRIGWNALNSDLPNDPEFSDSH